MPGRLISSASVKDGPASAVLHAVLVSAFEPHSFNHKRVVGSGENPGIPFGTKMEGSAALHSLTSMSRLSPASHHDEFEGNPNADRKILNASNSLAVGRASGREDDRVRQKGGKRKSSASRHRTGSPKRRRLNASISYSSKRKEGAVEELKKVANRTLRDRSISDKPVDSQIADESRAALSADLEGNHKGAVSNGEEQVKGSRVEEVFKKSTSVVADRQISAASDDEIRRAVDSEATRANNVESVDRHFTIPIAKVLGSSGLCVSGDQENPDQRVLRPRRQPDNASSQVSRVILREVKLPLADFTRIVGRRIKVYWPLDARWYFGLVNDYDGVQKLHKIVYDDHDEEWLSLHREKFRIQVFPAETFEPPDSIGGASVAEISSEHEVSATKSPEASKQWNVEKDGSAIGDDVLLSALIPRGRLKGPFLRKGLFTGLRKPNVLSPIADSARNLKETAVAASRVLNDDDCTLKDLAIGAKRDLQGRAGLSRKSKSIAKVKAPECEFSYVADKCSDGQQESIGGMKFVPDSTPTDKLQTAHEEGSLFIAKEHAGTPSTGKDVSSRGIREGKIAKVNDVGVAVRASSESISSRRLSNRSKVRSSLSEVAGASRSEGKRILRQFSRTAPASVPGGDVVVRATGRQRQVNQPQKSIRKSKLQPSNSNVKVSGTSGGLQTVLGHSKDTGARVNVDLLDDGLWRSTTIARERKRHVAEASNSCSGHVLDSVASGRVGQDVCPEKVDETAPLGWKIKFRHVLTVANATVLTTGKGNGFICQSGSELQQQRFGISYLKSTSDASRQDLRRAFYYTIHLTRPDVAVLDLFTRQLFNILKAVRLCDGDSFEERLSLNGSFQDLMGAVLLLLRIIKTLPLSEWTHPRWCRQWQSRILHEFWNVLCGSDPWLAESSSILPAKAEDALTQHLWQFFLEGNSVSHMTFRQVLNLLVCYFIKPYVIATICERGALLSVVIQHFLLPKGCKSPHRGGVQFVRQSVRCIRLRSGAAADSVFSAYLDHFPVSKDWRTENGLFQEHMKKWITSAACIGYAEQSTPVPSVELFSHLGLQATTAHVFAKDFATGSFAKNFHLKQDGVDPDGILRKSIIHCLRLKGEVRDGSLDRGCDFHIDFCESPDLFLGLFLTTMLQRSLYLAGGKSLSSAKVSAGKGNHARCGFQIGEAKPRLSIPGDIFYLKHKENGRVSKGKFSHGKFVSRKEVQPGQINVIGEFKTDGLIRGQAPVKRTKLKADARRNAFTTENNTSGTVKNGGIVEINGMPTKDGNTVLYNSNHDTTLALSANDVACFGSESLGKAFEVTVKPMRTGESGLGFKRQPMADQFMGRGRKEPWIDSKMAAYYSRALDRRKRKREMHKAVNPLYSDVSHLRVRLHAKRGRPLKSKQLKVGEHLPTCCSANLLITKDDRGWRELDVRVELQSNDCECFIAVQGSGGIKYTHKVQHGTPSGITNRYTHAIMWKGDDDWTLEFCDRKQWNMFKEMFEECGHRNARAAAIKQIPIPGVRRIEDFDGSDSVSTPFIRSPFGYICQTQGEVEAALKSTCIIYDLDSEDEAWLTEVNGKTYNDERSSSKAWIKEENLERIIDKLEKVAYTRHMGLVLAEEAIEICRSWESVDAVRAIYTYWCKKRLAKGTALVRQFQPPLWEQYQKQIQNWQKRLDELTLRLPSAAKEQLLEQCPRPSVFAFCLRRLDADNMNKKMQKQRSQRKITSVFKFSRALSFSETSEDTPRLPALKSHMHAHQQDFDPDWHPSSSSRLFMSSENKTTGFEKRTSGNESLEQAVSGSADQFAVTDPFTKAEQSQAKAAAAREVAKFKAIKSQRQFLKFDSALQRAVSAMIEFEAFQLAELCVTDEDTEAYTPTAANDQLSILKEKIGFLSRQVSNLLEKGNDSYHSSRDGSPSKSQDKPGVQIQEFQEEADLKQGLIEDADALLPMSGWGHLDSWMGTTLLQRFDKKE